MHNGSLKKRMIVKVSLEERKQRKEANIMSLFFEDLTETHEHTST